MDAWLDPIRMTFDSRDNIYIANQSHGIHELPARIYKVDGQTNIVSTVAGGGSLFPADGEHAKSINIGYPWNIVIDSAENIFVWDEGNYRILRIDGTTELASTFMNGGDYPGHNLPANMASIPFDVDLTVDADGNLYLADGNDRFVSNDSRNRVRKIDAETTLVSTVAGTGKRGFGGDGGPATEALLANPAAVAFDTKGNMYIADTFNNRIRKISGVGPVITGIEKNTIEHVSVYPNPGDGLFKFNIPEKNRRVSINVYNTHGQNILTQNGSDDVDLRNFPTGIYMIRFRAGFDKAATLRVVKR